MLAPLQQQVTSFWQHQSKPQKITLVALILAAAILIPLFVTWASTPTYAVAFSGLSEVDAGQIVQTLDESGIDYQLRDSSTIMVPSNQVYQVRLSMASEGLPQNSSVGYELFSGNTLGMTEFTQRVNYQRALEGELERTIGSLSSVEAVRVHVVTPEKTLLAQEQAPTTASITVQTRAGQSLDQSTVRSITHLVASAIEGLDPERVVIVDTDGNMLASGSGSGTDGADVSQNDSRRSAEVSAAGEVQRKVQMLLDSVLGPNRSVVQANVMMDWTQRETTSQMFNPTPAAVRSSSKTTETYTIDGSAEGGIPGAATNLPTPVAGVETGAGATNYARTEENLTYEITQSQSHEVSAPGQIERISLSVLVDGVTDPAELDTLRAAVVAAAGIDETRGDVLAVETLAFDRSYYDTQAEEMAAEEQTDLYIRIGEIAGAIILLAAVLWYISKLLKNLRLASAEAWVPVMRPAGQAAAFGSPAGMANLPGGLNGLQGMPKPLERLPEAEPEFVLPKVQSPSPQDEQMQRVLTHMAEENPANVADIIQLWLNEDEGKRG